MGCGIRVLLSTEPVAHRHARQRRLRIAWAFRLDNGREVNAGRGNRDDEEALNGYE